MSTLFGRRGWLAALGLLVVLQACSASAPRESIGEGESGLTANDKVAFDYFLAKGLTNFQAAGIVGNLDQESSMSPTASQPGGPGRGIAQWSVGGRWDTDANDNATAFAAKAGQSVWSLSLQLDFIWYELTTFSSYGLAPLKQSTNVTDATIAFEKDFEGCGNCQEATRISYAKAALAAYGADAPDASPPPADAGVACDVPGVGAGECIPTSACAALPHHVSTPGYCPGAADIECCTGPSDDAGAEADSGAPHANGDASAPPTPDQDAAVPGHDGPDSGKGVLSGSATTSLDSSTTTGCAMGARGARDERSWAWLFAGLGLIAIRRARERSPRPR